ncbi:uncharacterized protein DS421_14g477360 [Arachis hypogaea]|nr:uncharacterized protein DS421_14g477360 [Arachis hypogaea]
MHDALPSPRHTSKPVVVVVCRRGPPPRVQGRARASGCPHTPITKDQEGNTSMHAPSGHHLGSMAWSSCALCTRGVLALRLWWTQDGARRGVGFAVRVA